MIKKNVAEGF